MRRGKLPTVEQIAKYREEPRLAISVCGTATASPAKAEEEEDEETPLSMAIDAVDHWNGRDKKIELPDFAEREPKDDAKIPAWNARKAKHEATVKAAQALIDDARAKMPATVKPDMRPAWLHDALTEE